MFRMVGTMTRKSDGLEVIVDEAFPVAAQAQGFLAALKRDEFTATLRCHVTTAVGDVDYIIVVG